MINLVFFVCLSSMLSGTLVMSQFNLKKATGSTTKDAKAVCNDDMTTYFKEYINWMDAHNQVCSENNKYIIHLKKLANDLGDTDGFPLNYKVCYVNDVNVFVCADGSERVFYHLWIL